MKRIINIDCACSPNRPATSNEDIRLKNGVFEGGLGVINFAVRLALVDEAFDVVFRKPERHGVENGTTGAWRRLRSEVEWSKAPQL